MWEVGGGMELGFGRVRNQIDSEGMDLELGSTLNRLGFEAFESMQGWNGNGTRTIPSFHIYASRHLTPPNRRPLI